MDNSSSGRKVISVPHSRCLGLFRLRADPGVNLLSYLGVFLKVRHLSLKVLAEGLRFLIRLSAMVHPAITSPHVISRSPQYAPQPRENGPAFVQDECAVPFLLWVHSRLKEARHGQTRKLSA